MLDAEETHTLGRLVGMVESQNASWLRTRQDFTARLNELRDRQDHIIHSLEDNDQPGLISRQRLLEARTDMMWRAWKWTLVTVGGIVATVTGGYILWGQLL